MTPGAFARDVLERRRRTLAALLAVSLLLAVTETPLVYAVPEATPGAHPATASEDEPTDLGLWTHLRRQFVGPELRRARPELAAHGVARGPGSGAWQRLQSWLARPWSLDLDAPRMPPLLAALWVTSGVHRVLDWLAWPGADAGTPTVRDILAGLTVTPVAGELSSNFGYRRDPFRRRRRRMHKGVDYSARRGTPVYAAGPGVISTARRRGGYGRLVVIDHGQGVETRYAHLHRIRVRPGQDIPAGTLIGTVGSTGRATGPHLHFELRIDDHAYDPHRALGSLQPNGLLAAGH